MPNFITVAIIVLLATITPAQAGDRPTLGALAFLEGSWRGGDDFIFEEIWSTAQGGVMTAMARGVQNGDLRVLEYIVVAEDEGGLIMTFKHFNADYSTWESDGPVTLHLTSAKENDVTFTANPPSETVKSIRYWVPSDGVLQADIVIVEEGEEGGFSLTFSKAD